MAFILDTLLNQVDVVDTVVENPLDLNIIDYVAQIEQKESREEKYKFLQELASSIENYCLSHWSYVGYNKNERIFYSWEIEFGKNKMHIRHCFKRRSYPQTKGNGW